MARIPSWLRQTDAKFLASVALVVCALWGFVELADDVGEGDTRAFDDRVLLSLRNPADLADPLGPPAFEEAVRDITALGGYAVLVMVVFGATGFFLATRRRRTALFLFVAAASGLIVGHLLKAAFGRTRPEVVPHLARVSSESFPSGHSMMSAVIYLTIASVLSASLTNAPARIYLLASAMFVSLIVGASRVYLGVHYPTDVVGGWALGLVWAGIWWAAARYELQRRGEKSADG